MCMHTQLEIMKNDQLIRSYELYQPHFIAYVQGESFNYLKFVEIFVREKLWRIFAHVHENLASFPK
jgi:hypothetical protein